MSELGLRQLFLDFSVNRQANQQKFILSESNREAFLYVASWPNWPCYANLVYGPKGSGKSFIAEFWGRNLNAISIDLYKTPKKDLNYLLKKNKYFIFDDFDFYFTRKNLLRNLDKHEYDSFDNAFQDILDYIKNEQKYVFLTSNVPPNKINIKTPDLQNRINTISSFPIYSPDLSALRNMYEQKFWQYRMEGKQQIINYLADHSSSSYKNALANFEKIKNYIFSNNANLSLPDVKAIMSL